MIVKPFLEPKKYNVNSLEWTPIVNMEIKFIIVNNSIILWNELIIEIKSLIYKSRNNTMLIMGNEIEIALKMLPLCIIVENVIKPTKANEKYVN